jgi:hypothetical protein
LAVPSISPVVVEKVNSGCNAGEIEYVIVPVPPVAVTGMKAFTSTFEVIIFDGISRVEDSAVAATESENVLLLVCDA